VTKSVEKALADFMALGAEALFEKVVNFRGRMAAVEWGLGVCLLACQRKKVFRRFGYSDIYHFGEKELSLSKKRTWELLSGVQVLEHLPSMSEALQRGKICWSKVRALKGVVSPETEQIWVEYAVHHTTDEIRRTVTFTPKEWKRFQALRSSVQGAPIASARQVEQVIEGQMDLSEASESESPSQSPGREADSSASPTPEFSPPRKTSLPQFEKKIRLTFELDNNSYPLYERAANRVRARKGKRVSRNVILKELVESYLDQGTSRSRAKHQVLIHTDLEVKQGWYSTERGYLPVDPEVLAAVLKERAPIFGNKAAVAPTEEPTQANGRYIPTDTVRTLLAITDHRYCSHPTGHHRPPMPRV